MRFFLVSGGTGPFHGPGACYSRRRFGRSAGCLSGALPSAGAFSAVFVPLDVIGDGGGHVFGHFCSPGRQRPSVISTEAEGGVEKSPLSSLFPALFKDEVPFSGGSVLEIGRF